MEPAYTSLRLSQKDHGEIQEPQESVQGLESQLPSLATAIQNNRALLLFMDLIEEASDLTIEEWNFRNIISDHLEKLMNQQRIYLRQRGKVN